MNPETKTCQNCKNQFAIEPDDFSFYEKVKVPPPTFCPDCRMQRKLAYRNERRLYRRACDLCKKSVIAVYPEGTKFPVYCTTCWWSDNWDAGDYGQDYDFTKGFFEQFQEFAMKVPHLGMPSPSNNYQSEYTSWVDECKNCYLIFGSSKCEDCSYGELLTDCKNSLDSTNCSGLELSYQCVSSRSSYRCLWSVNSLNCSDCSLCYDCKGCNNCFLSYNQRNKSYLILNEKYAKEEWETKVKDILGSSSKLEQALKEFRKTVGEKAIHKFANVTQVVESTGNDLSETKNAYHCFDSSKLEDCRYVSYGDNIKDCMDSYAIVEKSELCYEDFSTRVTSRSNFMIGSWDSNVDMMYSQYVAGGSNLFGCMGLKKKSYCILNKQYDEKSYQETVAKIIASMKEKGEYGEFFPIAISAFAYNETLAADYYPLKKEEAIQKGYRWKDDIGGTFGKETVKAFELPDRIQDVKDELVKEILACTECGKNFRITQQELGFYRTVGIPIPRLCPDCRYNARLSFRNPRKLWHRSCMCDKKTHAHGEGKCSNEFETSYAPERPEIVYCEDCYNREVV